MNIQGIIEEIKTNESVGISKEKIDEFENTIGWQFPKEYKEILIEVDGGYGQIGKYFLDFWNLNDISFYYEDMDSIEGLIPFASDGCGITFAFETHCDAIFTIPMDCLEKSYAKKISDNFCEFIDKIVEQELVY